MTQRKADIRSGEALGRVIAEIRTTRTMTQAELAEESGTTRAYLSIVESGRTTRLLEMMLRILRVLGAHVYVVWETDDDGET